MTATVKVKAKVKPKAFDKGCLGHGNHAKYKNKTPTSICIRLHLRDPGTPCNLYKTPSPGSGDIAFLGGVLFSIFHILQLKSGDT